MTDIVVVERTLLERARDRIIVLEGQNRTLLGHLARAHERSVELKRQRDNMQNTLKHCRQSRDEWKRRAMKYQHRATSLYSRIWDARRSRDMWKYRALTREIEEGRANPRSKAWLDRNAVWEGANGRKVEA